MQYALDRLDKIVTEELHPEFLEKTGYDQYTGRIRSEIQQIRKFLWYSLGESKSKEQLKLLALQYQSSIDLLSEQVNRYKLAVGKNSPEAIGLYEQISVMLLNLFSYVQRHFSVWIIPEINIASARYVYTSFNEQELTVLLCALVDAGVVGNVTYTSFLEMVAPHLATRHKKGLTALSMLKSKDKLTADMKKKVKDILLFMAREIDQH